MSDFVEIFLTTMRFISVKIMTINIGGTALIYWIIGVLVVAIVVKFVFDNAGNAQMPKRQTRRNKENDE